MPKHKNYIHNPSNTSSVPQTTKGQKGRQGSRGIDGHKGERGPKGYAGIDGHTTTIVGSFKFADPATLPKNGTIPVGWDGGVNPPVPFSLEVGEAIIDLRTDDLWCFTPASNVSNWTKLGKLAGPRGINGQDGGRGFKGDTGLSGEDGKDGTKGRTGLKGERGSKGHSGTVGPKGQRGASGRDGTNGNNGIKGNKGKAGNSGKDGSRGNAGLIGPDGEKGQKGVTGSPGPRGIPGQRGAKGETVSDALVPRVGGTINFVNGGLHDRHNISKTEVLNKGVVRVFFAKPLKDEHYTAIVTTQTSRPSDVLNTQILEKNTNFLTLSLMNVDTGKPVSQGIASLVIYRFNF